MIIAVDEIIPYWKEAFARAGTIRSFSGRSVRREDLTDCEAVVVRSITRVDSSLLEGTPVRWVGCASIGMDHLDIEYLDKRGIRYANAAGSNANSVAEYVTAALLFVARRKGWKLSEKSLAIIGVGNVGSRVERKARALGMEVLLCDPPLRDATGDARYRSLDEVLDADILTLHVPLTRTGKYPTFHMVDQALLRRLSPRQYLVNSARGPVVDEPALKSALKNGNIAGAVLDVWENEPFIDYETLELADLGSPHIAGYSLDGKVRGTEMMLRQLSSFFGLGAEWDSDAVYPSPGLIRPEPGARGQEAVESVVVQAYDILRDDRNLRALSELPPGPARAGFDRLRNEYPLRPEFRHFVVAVPEGGEELAATLEGLGFQVRVGVLAC